jgi:hypothetical protein
MLLDSNKQHKEITKNRNNTTGSTKHTEKESREEYRPSGLTRSSPLTRLIQNHLEYSKYCNSKKKFSLLSNPLVLFNRIFRG